MMLKTSKKEPQTLKHLEVKKKLSQTFACLPQNSHSQSIQNPPYSQLRH